MQAPELDVLLKPSRMAVVYLIAVHAIAGIFWLLLTPSGWLKWLVFMLIVLSAGFYLIGRTVSQNQFRQMQWQSGEWYLIDIDNHRLQMVGLQSAFVSQLFVIMRFQDRDKRCLSLVVWSDALDKTAFRRLRMYCRDQRFYRQ